MNIGVLFDLDGTLLNTLEDLTDSVNYALAQFHCPPRTLPEVRDFIGSGARKLIERALPGLESDPTVDDVLACYQSYYKAHSKIKTRPYDGVIDAVRALQAVCPVAIVSNKPDAATKVLCKEYFGDVYARGESTDCPRKPAPDMLHKAMALIGADSCIYVGDSEVDVQTAKNAGVPCLSVTWGFRDRAVLEAAGAKHFCDDPTMLADTLKNMLESAE